MRNSSRRVVRRGRSRVSQSSNSWPLCGRIRQRSASSKRAPSPSLRALYVTNFKRLDRVTLAGANTLEYLLLDWATRLVDLSFVRDLPALRVLYLDSMKRIDLSTLPELPSLRGLHLGGSMWSTLKVESLAPLVRLPGLRFLRLSNVRPVEDRSDQWLS